MIIKSFDGLALSQYEVEDDIPLRFRSNLLTMAGRPGAFDSDGDEQYREPLRITRSFEIVESTYAAVDATLDSLRAKANLGRRWLVIEMRDGSERGTWAKLKQVEAPYQTEFLLHLPIDLTFEVSWPWFESLDDIWYLDAGYDLDDGLTFDPNYSTRSGAGSLTITNNGDDAIKRGWIVIKGTSTNPTISNAANGWSIAYAGTVPAGSTLFIDIGAQTAMIDRVSVWSDITIGNNQTGLFKLETGSNVITFTGGGTLEIHWSEVY